MQLGFFLLIAAAILLVGCDIVSASIDVDTTLSKTSSNLLSSADAVSVHGKVGRFLRTSAIADAASDDQNDESDDEERNLPSVVAEKAAGAAAELPRSKSLPSMKAAVQKLTRSKSAPLLGTKLTRKQVDNMVRQGPKPSLIENFKTMDRQKQDPDMMFRFFNLDHRLAGTTKADKYKLQEAAMGNDRIYSHYLLWYQFSKFYKKRHPHWVSNLVPVVVKAE